MATNYRSVITYLALQEVGTLGGAASGDDKYINYYNSIARTSFSVSTTPWCAIFVTYIMRHAKVPTSICPNYAGCTSFKNTFLVPNGLWKPRGSYTPKPGDIIMFNWSGSSAKLDHTGIVESVRNGKVYTVEGNSRGGTSKYGVRHNSYSLTSKYIIGYGALKLDNGAVIAPEVPVTPSKIEYIKKFQTWMNNNYSAGLDVDGSFGPKSKTAAVRTLQTILTKAYRTNLDIDGSFGPKTRAAVRAIKQGSKGNLVYLAQGILYGRGYDPSGFDGSFGPGMDTAVRNFQRSKNLAVDGSIGPDTWQKLCT